MSTTYSLTSKMSRVIATNPPVSTLNFANNIELDTVEQASSPGFGTSVFLANLPANNLAAMSQLADSAIAAGGKATIQYEVIQAGTMPSGQPSYVAVISSLSYDGKTVKAA